MTALERLALTAALLAATVVAGLALSTVPHVELVTLVVFSSGILLGAGRGALIGAAGMTLYVFANSAIKGFPPSPLPLLVAQALGMVFPGLAGGWWRRIWLRGGIPRRSALYLLPVCGVVLTVLYQVLTNLVFAVFLAEASAPRWVVFTSGMAFGLLDVVSNGIVFALAGPKVASGLRRAARERGWWGRASTLTAVMLCVGSASAPAVAAGTADLLASADTTGHAVTTGHADTTGHVDTTGHADNTGHADTTGHADITRSIDPTRQGAEASLRPLALLPEPLWEAVDVRRILEYGHPSLARSDSLPGGEASVTAAPGLPPSLDAWGLGWGRTTWSVDGLPLRGPVHGFEEPPDVPLAWRGLWARRRSASGTEFALAPAPIAGAPVSQVSITTGGYDRRTTEFGLFRTLGSVQLGVNFLDRIEQGRQNLLAFGLHDLEELDHSRLWLHLAPVPGRRPAWSVDVSSGREERRLQDGSTLERGARRFQASLTGPFLGGETRFAAQLRRHALRLEGGPAPFGEILFDGYTVQGEWAPPGPAGLGARVRWDRDRRRGLIDPRTFDGVRGTLVWARAGSRWSGGAEATAGHQEPYGFTWNAMLSGGRRVGDVDIRLSLTHEEDLPGLVVGLDRPSPEEGMAEHLEAFESAPDPEERTALRGELGWQAGPVDVAVDGWAGRIRNYRIDSNPLWVPTSLYSPVPAPEASAEVIGAGATLGVDLPWHLRGEGRGRVHSRASAEVPYLPRWSMDGAIHWRRVLFRESLDLDLALGGTALGSRQTPEAEVYPLAGTGYIRVHARIDNGVFTMAMENLLDAYLESDLRASDFVTPYPAPGRTFYMGITFYLFQ